MSEYPEVEITIGQGFLGDGVTGLKGVLLNLEMDNRSESSQMDSFGGDYFGGNDIVVNNVQTTRVRLEMILTSVVVKQDQGGPKVEKKVTKEIIMKLERAVDF